MEIKDVVALLKKRMTKVVIDACPEDPGNVFTDGYSFALTKEEWQLLQGSIGK